MFFLYYKHHQKQDNIISVNALFVIINHFPIKIFKLSKMISKQYIKKKMYIYSSDFIYFCIKAQTRNYLEAWQTLN
jgi:hypothetical protein